jgi:hypothetical protein
MINVPDKQGRLSRYETWKDLPHYCSTIAIRDEHVYHYNLIEIINMLELTGFKVTTVRETELGHINLKAKKLF